MTDTPPVDDAAECTREQRLSELAEKLCRSYTYGVGLEELQKTDPEDAGAHRDAAEHLLSWIDEAPKREIREAFGRGYDKGRDRGRASQAREMEQLRADLDRVQLAACRTAENLRHAEARVAELEKLLADELTALDQPQQPTADHCQDNVSLTVAIGHPVRCPHCDPASAPVPASHWTKHLRRHHPEQPTTTEAGK